MESVEETEFELLVLGEQNKGETGKNETALQRKTDRDTEGNSQKGTNLGETAAEQRNNTTQSQIGNKHVNHNSLWEKKS
eukprot:12151758-Ditylum_brightwellii.AAC.1